MVGEVKFPKNQIYDVNTGYAVSKLLGNEDVEVAVSSVAPNLHQVNQLIEEQEGQHMEGEPLITTNRSSSASIAVHLLGLDLWEFLVPQGPLENVDYLTGKLPVPQGSLENVDYLTGQLSVPDVEVAVSLKIDVEDNFSVKNPDSLQDLTEDFLHFASEDALEEVSAEAEDLDIATKIQHLKFVAPEKSEEQLYALLEKHNSNHNEDAASLFDQGTICLDVIFLITKYLKGSNIYVVGTRIHASPSFFY